MTIWLVQLSLVAAGGALGGIARLWVSEAVARRFGETFPWGTLSVNVTGAALIGGVAGAFAGAGAPGAAGASLWAALVVGGLGSYTTVSSFALQTLALHRAGAWRLAAMNVLGTLTLCLAAVAAGWAGARMLAGGP